MNFDGFEFKDYIVRALNDLGFKEFTDVQRAVFDRMKVSKNILAKSKTGSGKTHSFLVPIFESLVEEDYSVQAVIVAPTKELAYQIYKVAQHIASFSKDRIDIRLYSGGTDRNKEIERLKSSQPQIVIGTPGKVKDLAIDENVLKIFTAKYFIVDEVDMTFESGFSDDLDIVTAVLKDARLMFFSATMAESILPFIKKYMTNVEFIEIQNNNDTQIKHIWIPLKYKERYEQLTNLLACVQPYLCIIFANKKDTVIELAGKLAASGYFVGVMHGDLTPRERKRVLQECNKLKYQYLVATDLAARGIDIDGVSHIINYELPHDFEFYLHRSGRTGRMHKDGIVYSFYEDIDNTYLDNLAKKKVKPEYFELKNGELVEFKGRNTRADRIKPKTDYQKQAAKFVPKATKVKPGYKKKRQAEIDEIAKRLKKNEMKKKKRRY
ncbi:MAG: DEAD/DEAH box helicase [Erysipelotrichaceae bacterium]|nr:DEAD/DEAH box helicase [Erysipelotrichaceae bacterium]